MTLAQVPLATAIAPSTCPHHVTSGFYRTFLVPDWNFHIAAVGVKEKKEKKKKKEKAGSGSEEARPKKRKIDDDDF